METLNAPSVTVTVFTLPVFVTGPPTNVNVPAAVRAVALKLVIVMLPLPVPPPKPGPNPQMAVGLPGRLRLKVAEANTPLVVPMPSAYVPVPEMLISVSVTRSLFVTLPPAAVAAVNVSEYLPDVEPAASVCACTIPDFAAPLSVQVKAPVAAGVFVGDVGLSDEEQLVRANGNASASRATRTNGYFFMSMGRVGWGGIGRSTAAVVHACHADRGV